MTRQFKFMAMILAVSVFAFSSCKDDEDEQEQFGTMELRFENTVGGSGVVLTDPTASAFPYTNAVGQDFNISLLGYYVCKIELHGPNGEHFADEVTTGPNAADVKGFYHILQGVPASQSIVLDGVPAGKYNSVTFTLGVDGDIVQEGATGGVLDPANGAWFWNWNSGYIGFAFEGRSPASPGTDNSIQIHVGGWKEVPGNASMVNNVKRITLDFPSSVNVGGGLDPNAHIMMDLMKMLASDHMTADFTTHFSVHSPAAGQHFAHNLEHAFEVDHVHQ